MKKEIKTQDLENKKMDNATYSLRKAVMLIIYEIKAITPIPRITVRITNNAEKILACARVRKNVIWVTDRAINDKNFDLRTIVYHEIIHAVFGIYHNENCPLMKAIHTPLSKSECQEILKKYVKQQ